MQLESIKFYSCFIILFLEWLIFCVIAKIIHNDYTENIQSIKLPISILDVELFHFLLHFCMGIAFPNYLFECIIIGFIWELFEHLYGKYIDTTKTNNSNMGKYNENVYWSGHISDIYFNILGILFSILYLLFFKKTKYYIFLYLSLSPLYFFYHYKLLNIDKIITLIYFLIINLFYILIN